MAQWWSMALLLVMAGCLGSVDSPSPAATPSIPAWPALVPPLASPIADGNRSYTTQDYALGQTIVGGRDQQHADYEYEALIRGVITVPDGPGPFPLAVFLHGQHATCSGPDGREGSDCTRPYRNDMGYVYLMEHLASHGIATASILAFEINRQNGAGDIGMWARGELVVATIEALSSSPYADRLDFERIGLMGHSRGGEGVVTATEVNWLRDEPFNLSAVIALAPTDFALRNVEGIPFLTLAPYCDGDVYSLHGLRQFDQSRYVDDDVTKIQLLVMGANHNNYNTMWGRGWTSPVTDDGDDAGFGRHQNPECDLSREDGGGRMTLEDTYAEAKLHMGGFLRWILLGQDDLAAYFLGAPQPPDACPGRLPSCPGAVHVTTMTPARRDLFWVEQAGPVGAPGVSVPATAACQRDECGANVYSSAWMADLQIVGEVTFPIAFEQPQDVTSTPVLHVRVAVPTEREANALGPPAMTITFHDATTSKRVVVDHPALFVPPSLPVDPGVGVLGFISLGGAKVAANAVSIPVPESIDAGNLTKIELAFTAAGQMDRILVADAWMNRETAAPARPAHDL